MSRQLCESDVGQSQLSSLESCNVAVYGFNMGSQCSQGLHNYIKLEFLPSFLSSCWGWYVRPTDCWYVRPTDWCFLEHSFSMRVRLVKFHNVEILIYGQFWNVIYIYIYIGSYHPPSICRFEWNWMNAIRYILY